MRTTRIITAALVAAGALLSGCTGSSGGGGSRSAAGGLPGRTAAPVSGATAQALLTRYSTSRSADLDELIAHQHDSAVIAAARSALKAHAEGARGWAAVYVWSNSGDDPSLLVPYATDQDASLRLVAAVGLVGNGRVEGFAPLVAALTDTSNVTGAYPPRTVWSEASLDLARYTGSSTYGPPFDATAAQRVLAQQRWQAWLAAHRSTLRWDSTTRLWSVA